METTATTNCELFRSQEQMAEYRIREERLEKQYQTSGKDIKHLRDKCDQLEKTNKELQKDTENWLHAKTSLQVCINRTTKYYILKSSLKYN